MRASFHSLKPLVLASSSPRRQDFLREQGLTFRVAAPALPEPLPQADEHPQDYALRLARAKALEVWDTLCLCPGEEPPVILAADTIVVLEEGGRYAVLGKPGSVAEATAMLTRLVGRAHSVMTGCCIVAPGEESKGTSGPVAVDSFVDEARVYFASWPLPVLEAYAATGDPLDKAGGYSVQGRGVFLVERIDGSWATVAGLPVHLLMERLVRMGLVAPGSAAPTPDGTAPLFSNGGCS